MKKLLLLILIYFVGISLKAQDLTTTENFTVTYTIKLTEVANAIDAKDANLTLQALFDSNLQIFSEADKTFTIKSIFDTDEAKIANKLLSNGYTLLLFTKKYRITTDAR